MNYSLEFHFFFFFFFFFFFCRKGLITNNRRYRAEQIKAEIESLEGHRGYKPSLEREPEREPARGLQKARYIMRR